MSEWGAPQPSDTPGKATNGTARLLGRIAATERIVRDLPHQILRAALIRVEEGLLRVTGSLVVEGDLSVPNGSIRNDFLESPIEVATAHGWVQGFAITTTTTVYASEDVVVPEGYTRAIVASVGTGMGYNSSGASDWLYVAPTLTGAGGGSEVYTGVADGSGNSIASPYFDLLTGLTGGDTITIGCQMRTENATWPANGGNVSRVDAQITFLR